MLKTYGIGMTDGTNRKNHFLPTSVLVKGYMDSANELLPTNFGHDHNKLLGWSQGQGIFCEPQKTQLLISLHFAENDKELAIAKEIVQSKTIGTILSDHDEEYRSLTEKLGDNLSGEELKCWAGAASFYDEGIVLRTLPKLKELINRDLFPLEKLNCIGPGVYSYGDFLLFAHPYFRRGFSRSNSFNEEFLTLFQSLNDKNQTTQVALDMNLIGLLGSEQNIIEYDYWWGPKFSDNLEDIDFGVTRHENTKPTDFGLVSTEFGWYEQDGRRTFECEEVLEVPNINDEKYGCRFIHSMVDSETNVPYHLDGAIRAYTEEKMIGRLDTSLDKAGRDTEYTKIWRIDGVIPVTIWKKLIHYYYRGNSLIQEYFGGVNEECDETSNTEDALAKKTSIENTLICDIKPNDGIRFALKVLPKDDSIFERDFQVNLIEEIPMYHEAEALDLVKILRKNSLSCNSLKKPIVDFMDLLTNFPILSCSNLKDAGICLGSLKEIVKSWKKRNEDRLVTFTIRIPYSESLVSFSFGGHVNDIDHFLSQKVQFPERIDAIPEWVEWLSKKSVQINKSDNIVRPWSIFNENGQIRFERDFINQNHYELSSNEGNLLYNYESENEEIGTLLKENKIKIKPAIVIGKSICSSCGNDYNICDCTHILDEKIYQKIEEISEIRLFFTIKPI